MKEEILLAETAIDILFESIYNETIKNHIKIVDGKYIISVDCGSAPIVSGQNKITKEE
jgi:hypothetical protein